MNKLINRDQTGFVAGRNIKENLRKISDTAEYAKRKKIEGLMLVIDFEKAFDMAEYHSLYKILEICGFSEKMITWVKILFTNFNLCTINNGIASDYFTPTRGLFQGNPISSYCFVIIIETLAVLMRNNKSLQGIQIGKFKNLLSMFADDMTVFLQNKEREWMELRSILDKFRLNTGLRVNYDKTTVYRLGHYSSNAWFYSMRRLQWSDGTIKILGIAYTDDDSKLQRLNLEPLLEKAEQTLDLWRMRDLTLIGKIMVFNTLIASTVYHRLAVAGILKEEYIKKFEKLASSFIWNRGTAKITMKVLQGNKKMED